MATSSKPATLLTTVLRSAGPSRPRPARRNASRTQLRRLPINACFCLMQGCGAVHARGRGAVNDKELHFVYHRDGQPHIKSSKEQEGLALMIDVLGA